MFIMVTGNPGSGKSYYAVSYIYDKLDDYRCVYANINGLKLGGKIKPLNHPAVYEIIKKCKEIYDYQVSILGTTGKTNVIDEPIIEYLKEVDFIDPNPVYDEYLEKKAQREAQPFFTRIRLNITNPIKPVPEYLPTLLIYDEAQNQFPAYDTNTGKELRNSDAVISWWVSYHRHLFMDVILLSQYYQKVHTAYRRDIEYFLDAVPSSLDPIGALMGSFSYRKHMDTPYFKKNRAGVIRVKKRKEVFDMYKSGDEVRTKSAVLPWFIFSSLLLVLVVVVFYFLISSYSSESTDSNQTVKPNYVSQNRAIVPKETDDNFLDVRDRKYLRLVCMNDFCVNRSMNIRIDIEYIEDLLKSTDSHFLGSRKVGDHMAFMYFLASPEFLGLFQHRSEKDEKGTGFIFP